MNRRTFLTLFACALPLVGGTAVGRTEVGVGADLLLDCIAQVETGGRDPVVGPRGERSKYQITYAVWVQHAPRAIRSRQCFEQYCSGVVADALAREHLEWIVRQVGTQPFAVVAAWHLGVEGSKRKWTPAAKDHVTRAVRLYRERGGQ